MYHLNSEYDFVRTATGKTSSVTVAVSVYDEETIPTKKKWARSSATEQIEFDIPDFSSLTPVETQSFIYTIPTNLQTTATLIDRSSNADTDLGQYEEYFYKIRDEVEKDSVYESLNQKYMPSS
jgi:hypothetical protein